MVGNNRISGIFHLSGNKRNKFGGKEEDSSYSHFGSTNMICSNERPTPIVR